jgi:hypothetical protein
MQSYKNKEQYGRMALEYKKDHNAPPHGLGGYYHLEEQLSIIVPRI